MASKQGTLFLLAGAGALLFMSGSKKKRVKKPSSGKTSDPPSDLLNGTGSEKSDDLDEEDGPEDIDTTDLEDADDRVGLDPDDHDDLDEPDDASAAAVLARNMSPDGKAALGRLYQVRIGDTPEEVCREALFGSRSPVTTAVMRAAEKELLIRIDCGPWNQALYGLLLDDLNEGREVIEGHFTQKGVSINPVYQDNQQRILNGLRPTSEPGNSFALIWIPMINLFKFKVNGEVTTQGMNHPDTINGMGGSMIDPPQEIIDLEFDEVSSGEVGCDLPEGDYRRTVEASA